MAEIRAGDEKVNIGSETLSAKINNIFETFGALIKTNQIIRMVIASASQDKICYALAVS